MRSRQVLFALHDWGLGHASRSLLLIRALLAKGDRVLILMAPSSGMTLLKSELGNTCEFYPYSDIPKPFSRWPFMFYIRMSLAMPAVWARYKLEHILTEKLVRERNIDIVISDSRFGVWSKRVPSYCILHSLRQIIPGRSRALETLVEWGQRNLLNGFDKVLIPDVGENDGLSGDLGHHPALNWGEDRLCYIGPLSDVRRPGLPEDVDYFFSISGIEPQRTLLERKVMAALPKLTGHIVVTLGRPQLDTAPRQIGNVTVYNYLNREQQARMLNRARLIVSRSGYTTLMELAELGKKALFIPTPGQSEQEYLADFHRTKKHVWSTTQARLDLLVDLDRARAANGVPRHSSTESPARFLEVIDS